MRAHQRAIGGQAGRARLSRRVLGTCCFRARLAHGLKLLGLLAPDEEGQEGQGPVLLPLLLLMYVIYEEPAFLLHQRQQEGAATGSVADVSEGEVLAVAAAVGVGGEVVRRMLDRRHDGLFSLRPPRNDDDGHHDGGGSGGGSCWPSEPQERLAAECSL